MMCTDANARVGSLSSDCIGEVHASVENCSGKCLHDIFHEHRLFLPSTFGELASESCNFTWYSRSGVGHRGDYIA
eukprot:9785905-Lingulodinium_polyedra.AAC.1